MPKQIAQDVISQMRKIAQDTFEQAGTQTKQVAGSAFEQVAGNTFGSVPQPQVAANQSENQNLPPGTISEKEKKEFRRKVQINKLKEELEREIARARQLREQQIQQRINPTQENGGIQQLGSAKAEEQKQQPQQQEVIQTSKRRGGIFGGGNRKVKSAQDQSQPETAGKRVSG